MGKDANPTRFAPNQCGATAKFIRVPPRKARLVLDAVRGKYATDALAVLKFVPNRAARAIEKVILSAVANAENGRPLDPDTGRPQPALVTEHLKVVRVQADDGPRIKRVKPRAQGRAYRILKRMCHITVVLEEVPPLPRPVRRKTAGRPQQPAAARPAQVAPAAPAPVEAQAPQAESAPAETAAATEEPAPADDTALAEAAAPDAPEPAQAEPDEQHQPAGGSAQAQGQ